jgi:UDP-glucuronate decarboxylase
MDTPVGVTGPINLGNPVEFTVLELANRVIALTGSQSEITFHDLPEDDPVQRRPDISKAGEALSWSPSVNLDKGLGRTIDYFSSLLDVESPRRGVPELLGIKASGLPS